MADFDELLRMAQRLEHQAHALQQESVLGPVPPQATLGAQVRKADDMEEDVVGPRSHAPPARVNLRHKRSQEAAVRSVAINLSSTIDYDYDSEDDLLDENSSLDTIVARSHSQLLNKCLERAQNGSAMYLQWARDHDSADMAVATSRLSELCSLRDDLASQSRPLHLSSASLGRGSSTHWGLDGGPLPSGTSDWRARRYAECVTMWMSGQHSWSDVIACFKQLAAEGPLGARQSAGPAQQLWDSVAAVLEGASVNRSQNISRVHSTADRIRAHLEMEYKQSLLEGSSGGSVSSAVANLVRNMQQRDPNRMGHSEAPAWAQAYLCLRAGDFAGCVLALRDSKNAKAEALADELPEHWPPYKMSGSEGLVEREPSPVAVGMSQLTPLDYEANPFRCAVILILSRSCTVQAHTALWNHLARREVVHFAQDRVWLHLSLCAKPGADKELYSLAQYQSMAETAKVSDFADPYLYCRVMLWSLCAHRLVSVLIPPTVIDSLADFSLEGLHICVLLLANNCITDASVAQRVKLALNAYTASLVPEHPDAAVHYLKLLPSAAEASLTSLCTTPEACHALLGSVDSEGQVHEGAIVGLYEDRVVRGGVVLSIATSLRDSRASVLLVCELMLVAMHVGDGLSAARALVQLLSTKLIRAVEELDAGSILSLSVEAHDTLRAAEVVVPQLERMVDALPEVGELRQVHLLTKLCCSVASRDAHVWGLVTQCTTAGLLPANARDVPRCTAFVNTKSRVPTVRRALPVAASLTLSAIAQESQSRSFASLPCPLRQNLLALAEALVMFGPNLRIPATDATSNRVKQARALLSQIA